MRKLMVVLGALILVLSLSLGTVYASTSHQKMTGWKLVGYGPNGKFGNVMHYSNFTLTNPDCTHDINIDRVAIVRDDGQVMYEGPLYAVMMNENMEVIARWQVSTLQPHRTAVILLNNWMPANEPGTWLPFYEAFNLPQRHYTVEVSWHGRGLPLIGSASVGMHIFAPDGALLTSTTASLPMEAMRAPYR